jgi:MFS family permease
LPGGIVSDYFRHHRGRLMMVCMIMFALGWFIVGLSPVYALLIVGIVALAIAGSVWHLPSVAELGAHFAKTRGTSMAVFGAGGSIGDIIGPMITGVLLGYLSWRGLISIYAIIPFLMAFVVLWVFNGGSRKTGAREKAILEPVDLRTQLKTVREVMKKTHIWRVNIVAGFRGMCFDIVTTFFPLFMKDELGMSSSSVGFHFGLLWAIGITVSPLMGYLSDKFGRKRVLVPALLYSTVLLVALGLFGEGVMFTVLLALLGISIRSDYSILTATILDIAGEKVATTMLGILSFTRFMMAAAAPLIAGALYQYAGMDATLYFVAVLFTVSAIIFLTADLEKKVVSQ